MLDEIAVLRRRAKTSFAAASLPRISRDRRALDVTTVRDRDRDVFVGDKILDRKLDTFVDDLRAAPVTKLFFDFLEFFRDDASQRTLVAENLFQLADEFDDAFVLVNDLLPF